MLEKEYRQWLTREGYQPNSVATSLSSTRSAEKIWSESLLAVRDMLLEPRKSVLKRYSRFLHTIPFPRWHDFERFVVDNYEAARPQLHGRLTKPPLTASQWQEFISWLSLSEEPENQVLLVLLRLLPEFEPQQALQTPLKDFSPALATLLAPMREAKARHLWDYFSTTPYGALARLQRRLRAASEELGFQLDFLAIAKTPPEVRLRAA